MYSFFYPETNKRAFGEYGSIETAKAAPHKALWQEINAPAEQDLAAFLNTVTGEIVVLRKL